MGMAGKLDGILAPELVDQQYEIVYISKLALALRILETRSVAAAMDAVAPLQEQFPVFDNYNLDKVTRGIADRFGVPPEMMNTEAERDSIREGRKAEADEQRAAELAIEAGKVIPPSKEIEEGSPLAALSELAV